MCGSRVGLLFCSLLSSDLRGPTSRDPSSKRAVCHITAGVAAGITLTEAVPLLPRSQRVDTESCRGRDQRRAFVGGSVAVAVHALVCVDGGPCSAAGTHRRKLRAAQLCGRDVVPVAVPGQTRHTECHRHEQDAEQEKRRREHNLHCAVVRKALDRRVDQHARYVQGRHREYSHDVVDSQRVALQEHNPGLDEDDHRERGGVRLLQPDHTPGAALGEAVDDDERDAQGHSGVEDALHEVDKEGRGGEVQALLAVAVELRGAEQGSARDDFVEHEEEGRRQSEKAVPGREHHGVPVRLPAEQREGVVHDLDRSQQHRLVEAVLHDPR
eukprot:Rhum_TRINITY_DN14705_c7_g1::Rhum_TRINITY_DN14705_c7_g1_i1::g.112214::m.112214